MNNVTNNANSNANAANTKGKWAICTKFKNTGFISIGPYFFETRIEANDALAEYHYRSENGDPCIQSTWLQQEENDERYYYSKTLNKYDYMSQSMDRSVSRHNFNEQ
jgi:hypothetical protein